MSKKEEFEDLKNRAKGNITLDPKEFEENFVAVMDEGKVVYECKTCKKHFPTSTDPFKFQFEITKHKFIIDKEAEEKHFQEHFLNPRVTKRALHFQSLEGKDKP